MHCTEGSHILSVFFLNKRGHTFIHVVIGRTFTRSNSIAYRRRNKRLDTSHLPSPILVCQPRDVEPLLESGNVCPVHMAKDKKTKATSSPCV
jgi:hypothetical protein